MIEHTIEVNRGGKPAYLTLRLMANDHWDGLSFDVSHPDYGAGDELRFLSIDAKNARALIVALQDFLKVAS